ncbi:MAG: hypothetical protein QW469_02275 [Candidatus Aenigmatarchaeota archaeon]
MAEIEIPIKIGDIPIKIPITLPTIQWKDFLPTSLIPSDLSLQTAIILIVFILSIFFLYRTMKLLIKAMGIGILGFLFPWIISFLGLSLGISPDISTGIQFAFLAVLLFFIYEFFHLIKFILKIILFPFLFLLGLKKKDEFQRIKKEYEEIERKKRVFNE